MYLTQWIDSHANIRPTATAIIDAETNRHITYYELRGQSLGIAAWLERQGLRTGDRVAVFSSNRPEVLEILFACARLGLVMVPVNTRLAAPEQERILDDCRPRIIIAEPGTRADGIWIDTVDQAVDAPEADPDQPLLILYTGGTTGIPKGAILTQRSLQWNAWNTIAGWGLNPNDVGPIFTPFFHTGGLNVFATPLLALGATVVLPARGSFEPAAALELVEKYSCTLFFAVPTMYQKLREHDVARLKNVRLLISGGAPCPEVLMKAYAEDGMTIRQGYGLTEAGPNNFSGGTGGSVGTPLPHVRVRLQTADGSEAKIGEVGELLVAGPHLMNGYWQRAESPIRDGWLHTGDLACRDAEGRYYICGRSKEMYISGGENVFPAEVEDVLGQHPDVEEVAVVGVPDTYWGEVGRAYLVMRNGANPEQLQAYCRARLAGYKVPKQFVVREALPKSPVGKVLKHLLVQ